MSRTRKAQRQQGLVELLASDPFFTDQELAEHFQVSIQTIRLDRLELGLPELRERVKHVAEKAYGRVKSVASSDIIGDLIEINLDKSGISVLDTDTSMGFANSNVVRGHHIFAQANSLAVALVDAPLALTGSAEIRYLNPVKTGERIVAKAYVLQVQGKKRIIRVESFVRERQVFRGEFILFCRENITQG